MIELSAEASSVNRIHFNQTHGDLIARTDVILPQPPQEGDSSPETREPTGNIGRGAAKPVIHLLWKRITVWKVRQEIARTETHTSVLLSIPPVNQITITYRRVGGGVAAEGAQAVHQGLTVAQHLRGAAV
jgi:hypothetical protein